MKWCVPGAALAMVIGIAGCSEPFVPSATSGMLDVIIVGLPEDAAAGVAIAGPVSHTVNESATLELPVGGYTINAPVVQANGAWYPNVTSHAVALGAATIVTTTIRYSRLPVAGTFFPQLQLFDSVMVAFMTSRNIGAGTLSISRQGLVIYRRAFGWRDSARTEPLTPHALFRLASNSKPATSAAVRRLVAQGALSLDTKAFTYLGVTPSDVVPDQRIYDISVQHLLDHTGGWNATIAGDYMFRSRDISSALGIATPPTASQVASYVMTRPLQHAPGTATAYSNFGYVLLGLIVEKAAGQPFVDYVKQQIFTGSAASEVVAGRSLRVDRDLREPFYADPSRGCSVFVVGACVLVPWPDGGWFLEALGASGGLVASAPAMATFLGAYWINGQPRTGGASASFTFFGSLDGTFTMMRQRTDGTNIVALFNQRTDASGLLYEDIELALDAAATSVAAAIIP